MRAMMDAEGKRYLSNPVFFADAFNYLLYDGEKVIRSEEHRELDTAELTVPHGNSVRVPVQKYRDLLKLGNAIMDENATDLEHEVEPGGVDMCKAMDKRDQRNEVAGVKKHEKARRERRKYNHGSDGIVNVTREYVLALLAPTRA